MTHAVIVNHNAGSPYHGPNFRSYYAGVGWVQSGMKVTIVCSSFSHKLHALPEVAGKYSIEMIDGIRYVWLKTRPFSNTVGRLRNFIEFGLQLKLLESIVTEPVDYVICSSPPPLWIWSCRKFASLKDASLIFEVRDLWPDVIFETTRSGIINPVAWYMKAAEKAAYRCADRVVAVNESAIQVIGKRGVSDGKFSAIPNGVRLTASDDEEEASDATSLCEELKRKGNVVVGYSGALSRVYGLSYLVDAAELLRNEKIVFVLAGSGPCENWLRERAQQLPNLKLVGWIPKPRLQDFLRSVDVCYAGLLNVPSLVYGSDSTKIYEYMKAAKPILHAIGDENCVVTRANCGLRVDPEDANALAHGVRVIAEMAADERQRLGVLGSDFVNAHRSYDVLNRKWMELFDSLREERGPSCPSNVDEDRFVATGRYGPKA